MEELPRLSYKMAEEAQRDWNVNPKDGEYIEDLLALVEQNGRPESEAMARR